MVKTFKRKFKSRRSFKRRGTFKRNFRRRRQPVFRRYRQKPELKYLDVIVSTLTPIAGSANASVVVSPDQFPQGVTVSGRIGNTLLTKGCMISLSLTVDPTNINQTSLNNYIRVIIFSLRTGSAGLAYMNSLNIGTLIQYENVTVYKDELVNMAVLYTTEAIGIDNTTKNTLALKKYYVPFVRRINFPSGQINVNDDKDILYMLLVNGFGTQVRYAYQSRTTYCDV